MPDRRKKAPTIYESEDGKVRIEDWSFKDPVETAIRKEMTRAATQYTVAEMQHPSLKSREARMFVAKAKRAHLEHLLKEHRLRKSTK